jgi:serine/threonine protein kinase
LHQHKIAHRDIKPSNILLDKYDRIKLADFGLSQHVISNTQTDFCGSKLFIPPEIWNHVQDYDLFSADIYSLGVLFYYMYQGEVPFFSSTEEGLKKLVLKGDYEMGNRDTELTSIIHKMMKKDPKERPTSSQLLDEWLFQKIKASSLSSLGSSNHIQSLPKVKSGSIKYNQFIGLKDSNRQVFSRIQKNL